MSGKLKAAIVGCGSVSTGYFPFVSETFDLVATADLIVDRAKEMARIWGAQRAYDSMDALLANEKLDAVFILTAMSTHNKLVLQAIDAGVNFLVQKPFTTDLQAGIQAVKAARAKGLKGLVEPNSFQSPVMCKAREIIAEGHIGRPLYARGYVERGFIPQWGGLNFYEREGGGILFDMGVYPISELITLLGPATAVTAMSTVSAPERMRYGDDVFTDWLRGFNRGDRGSHNDAAVPGDIPTECEAFDNTMTLIQWPGDLLGCVIANAVSFIAPPPNPRLIVCGEKGSLIFGMPGIGSELSVATNVKDSPYHVPKPPPPAWTNVGRQEAGWYHFPANYFAPYRYYKSSTEHLYACIEQNQDPIPSMEWGLHVAEVMIGSRTASETGQVQQLKTTF
ncbi:MAG: Gfo/Idh/MocA family protein [Anaerolineae bacterium]|jgi:predicted dehydrogenase